jgi:hypothetical protein
MGKSSRSFLVTLPYHDRATSTAAVYQCVLAAANHSAATGLVEAIARDRRAWLRLLGYEEASFDIELRGETRFPEDNPAPTRIRVQEIGEVCSRPADNERLLAALRLVAAADCAKPVTIYPRPTQHVFSREVGGRRVITRVVVRNSPRTLKH